MKDPETAILAALLVLFMFAPPVAAWFRWRKQSDVWRQGSVLPCLFTSWPGFLGLIVFQSYLEGRKEAEK